MGRRGNFNNAQFDGGIGGTPGAGGSPGGNPFNFGGGNVRGGRFGTNFGGGVPNRGSLTGSGNTVRGPNFVKSSDQIPSNRGGLKGSGNTVRGPNYVNFVDPPIRPRGGNFTPGSPPGGNGGASRGGGLGGSGNPNIRLDPGPQTPSSFGPNSFGGNFSGPIPNSEQDEIDGLRGQPSSRSDSTPRANGGSFLESLGNKWEQFKDGVSDFFGRNPEQEDGEDQTVSTPPPKESRGPVFEVAAPAFLGGQVDGESYQVTVQFKFWTNPTTSSIQTTTKTITGPVKGLVIFPVGQKKYLLLQGKNNNGPGSGTTVQQTTFGSQDITDFSITNIVRLDGTSQPDDRSQGGDRPGNTTSRPPQNLPTIQVNLGGGGEPPPTIFIPDVEIELLGPGEFFVDPPVGLPGTQLPPSIAQPVPEIGTPAPPSPTPQEIPAPTATPTQAPSPAVAPSPTPTNFIPVGVPVPVPNNAPGFQPTISPGSNPGFQTGSQTGTQQVTEIASNPVTNPTNAPTQNLTPQDTIQPFNPAPATTLEPEPEARPELKPGAIGRTVNIPRSPSPPAPPGAGGTGGCSACSRAIGSKVDTLGNKLGLFGQAAQGLGQVIDLGLLTVINNKLGPQVPGGLSAWLKRFSQSLRLDRVVNILGVMLSLHNAAMLSRNLGDSLSFFLQSGAELFGIKDEDDQPIDINGMIGSALSSFLQSIVGEEIYTGVSTAWKKTSAIYTATVRIYQLTLESLSGVAEGLQTIGQYTGKIGNALRKAGLVAENAYDWMDENVRIKTGRLGLVQQVTEGIQQVEDVTSNLTEVTEQVRETQENINEIQSQFDTVKNQVTINETEKKTEEDTGKENSVPPAITTSDLNLSN